MKFTILHSLIILFAVLLPAQAKQFYKWVDENGVTHYGEELPTSHVEHVILELPDEYVKANPEEDYHSIQNQLKRLQDRRVQQHELSQQSKSSQPDRQAQVQEIYIHDREPVRRYFRPIHNKHYPIYPYTYKPCCDHKKIARPSARISHGVRSKQNSSGFTASR